jgi:hypothetical protein
VCYLVCFCLASLFFWFCRVFLQHTVTGVMGVLPCLFFSRFSFFLVLSCVFTAHSHRSDGCVPCFFLVLSFVVQFFSQFWSGSHTCVPFNCVVLMFFSDCFFFFVFFFSDGACACSRIGVGSFGHLGAQLAHVNGRGRRHVLSFSLFRICIPRNFSSKVLPVSSFLPLIRIRICRDALVRFQSQKRNHGAKILQTVPRHENFKIFSSLGRPTPSGCAHLFTP